MRTQDVHLSTASFGYQRGGKLPPELPAGTCPTAALVAVRQLWSNLGLDQARYGTADWNPLGELIGRGKRVLIKPNWVRHEHLGGSSLDSLVTHTSVLEAVLHYVVRAAPQSIVVGDAPVQGCDFPELMRRAGVDELQERFAALGFPICVSDFRRTILTGREAWGGMREDRRPFSKYVLFDLGRDSYLEEITTSHSSFRVTMYDPRSLQRAHTVGRHQYLVAREAIDADVVLNLPKLKTHKKAGVTAALKNVVGINGHKEYLPHHRKGGCVEGGDCYGRSSLLKRWIEYALDRMNSSDSLAAGQFWSRSALGAVTIHRLLGGDGAVEGSWYGNDTIWRTCLDLQRILNFGRADGTLAEQPQRQVLHLTDAIVAGEGEGPMMPDGVPLGLLTCGRNAAAVDWVHAWLMGFDPRRIPLVRESFASRAGALADFSPDSVRVWVDGRCVDFAELARRWPYTFRAPAGWRGHCERIGAPSAVLQQRGAA